MLTICSSGGKWVKQGYEPSNDRGRGILYPEPVLIIFPGAVSVN